VRRSILWRHLWRGERTVESKIRDGCLVVDYGAQLIVASAGGASSGLDAAVERETLAQRVCKTLTGTVQRGLGLVVVNRADDQRRFVHVHQ